MLSKTYTSTNLTCDVFWTRTSYEEKLYIKRIMLICYLPRMNYTYWRKISWRKISMYKRLLELSVLPRIDKRLFRQNVSKVILPTSYLTSVFHHVRITTSGEAGRPSSRAFGPASRPSRTVEKNSVYPYVKSSIVILTLSLRRSSVPLSSSRYQ